MLRVLRKASVLGGHGSFACLGVMTGLLAFVTRCQVAINKFLYILLRSSKLGKHLLTARLNY